MRNIAFCDKINYDLTIGGLAIKQQTADLHTHTSLSDGSSSRDELFRLAGEVGLSHIAITDHNIIPQIGRDDELSRQYGVGSIRGVEISTLDHQRGRNVHILCYLPKHIDEIEKICKKTCEVKAVAGLEMTERVAKIYPLKLNEVLKNAENSSGIFKQHIMQTLMNMGICSEMYGETFKKLFRGENSCSVRYELPETLDVVKRVRESQGVCIMAHPYTCNGLEMFEYLAVNKLIDGVEVCSGKTNSEQEEYLMRVAEKYDLIATGGSDFHGKNVTHPRPIGIKTTNEKNLLRLFSLAANR